MIFNMDLLNRSCVVSITFLTMQHLSCIERKGNRTEWNIGSKPEILYLLLMPELL